MRFIITGESGGYRRYYDLEVNSRDEALSFVRRLLSSEGLQLLELYEYVGRVDASREGLVGADIYR